MPDTVTLVPSDDLAHLPGRAREARENDSALLRAACQVFAEAGYGAPMSAVAQRAGIGVAGIYRRYPSKDALIQELRRIALVDIIDTARSAAERAATDPESSAVALFLRTHLATAESRLSSVLNRSTPLTPELERLSAELHDALAVLTDIDRTRGLLPDGFGPGDIMAVTLHLRPVASVDPEEDRARSRRHLEYFLLGLRTSAQAAPIDGIATTWDDWMRLNSMPKDA